MTAFLKTAYYRLNALMFAISLSAFLFLNNHSLLNNDEMGTMLEMRMPWSELLRYLFTEDVHPPVYFVLLKIWTGVVGNTVFTARCFSYAGVLLCAFGAGRLIKTLYGERAGLWFTAFFLFLPMSFWLAKTIRMYSWACFFCTAAFLSAQAALSKGQKKYFILYTVYAFLGSWTHYYATLACAMIALSSLWQSRKTEKFKSFFLCNAILFAGVLPLIYIVLRQNLGETAWITEKDVMNADIAFFTCFNLSVFLRVLSGIVMIFLWFSGFRFLRKGAEKDRTDAVKAGLFVVLGVWGVPFACSIIFRPVLYARYLTVAFGCLYVFFLFGVSGNRRIERIAGVLIFAAFFFMIRFERKDVDESVQPLFYRTVGENVAPDDVIIENDWQIRLWLYYRFPNHDIRTLTEKKPVDTFKKRKKTIDAKEIGNLTKGKKVFATRGVVPETETEPIFDKKDGYSGRLFSLEKILKSDGAEKVKKIEYGQD